MTRPARPDQGTCPCPTCSGVAKIRTDAKDRHYLYCGYCIREGLQEYILENGHFFGANGKPVDTGTAPEPVPGQASNNADVEILPPAEEVPEEPEPGPEQEPEPEPAPEAENSEDWWDKF